MKAIVNDSLEFVLEDASQVGLCGTKSQSISYFV